ncbi:uncharacterized protein BX664DRAFT_73464 [Halteromyces radiatus]|uniref:uncharacterized protein n=1 Tax=Halteromyces radiatus TaxID=101107 RepID=UPI002221049B|nr:uncharacterized protein BX664DRAFT_73464 [Halteromyces radiatus]KAI8097130.1 hypothetical protein BX664DRAFT_73464 [Halteromyces radiatus]
MFSWLQPWRPSSKIQRKQDSHPHQHNNVLSTHSFSLSEKTMITPKSIAIVKKTAVHVSGDDVSGIHYQSNETQDNSSTTVSSAASVALSAELAKKQQLQQLSHIDTTTTMQQHSSNTSIRSIKSVSTSSSPPKHQPIQQQSNSTTSQASSTTCISTVPSHVVMHPSPKRSATPFSTNVSANGDIVFETHIMAPHSPMVAPSSSSYSNSQQPQQIDSPTSMDRPVPEQVSMISISLAEKHLLDMIHPLPPPISPLSITCTSDAMDQPPDLHLSDQHDGQTQQYSQHSQQQIQPSLDQHDQDHNMQISTAPQQVVEEEAPSIQQKRFWTWLFPPPPIALSTNQNKESLPSASSSPISNNVTKKNNPHNQLHNNNNNNNNNISPGPPLLSEMSSSPIPVPSSSYIESSSPSVISSPASSSVQPMINNRKGGRRNQVLPPFRSQYRVPPSSSSTATINNNIKPSGKFFDKAIESINQFIQQASSINSGNNKSADRVIHTDPDSWKQQMKARFARFIDDIKSDPDGFAGKKIVVVGVHGWFPMKVML